MIVFRRELRTLLTSPQAWAVASAYLLISGLFFVTLLFSHPFSDLERYYTNIETTLIVVAPIIAMRSFAEERRSGVLDLTLSWPASRWSLVLGKYAANAIFTWVLVSIAWLYVVLLGSLGEVEVGKAAAGWIGLLLLTAMFNAVALAVSARSSSPTSAAFVGFGVLLGLWILDFVPGWLGGAFDGVIRFLAPTNHIDQSGRGIIDAGDALYFVMGAAFGLTLAGMALRERGRRGFRSAVRLRHTPILAGFLAVVAIGFASEAAQGQVDLTPERRFTLTAQTEAVLDRVERRIEIRAFTQPGTAQYLQMRSLIGRYQRAHGDVTLEWVDPDAQPGRVRELGGGVYGEMLVRLGGRQERISEINEIALTSALQRLSRTDPPLACFTVGHGERTIDDQRDGGYLWFGNRLKSLGYRTASLALGARGGAERLAACRVVIVAGPRAPFLPEELGLLGEFARREGRLVVLAEKTAPEVTGQLNELIRPWGLAIRPEIVRDRSSLINDAASVLAFKYPSSSPVTHDLRRHGIPVLLPGAQPVETVLLGPEQGEDYAWLSPLVQTSSRSSLPGGGKGPFVLGAITDWSRLQEEAGNPEVARTRIGVVGNAAFASNLFFGRFGNATFASHLVSFVAVENDIIAAARDPGGATKLAITQDDRGRLVRAAVVAPPGVTLVLFLLALLRLRRS